MQTIHKDKLIPRIYRRDRGKHGQWINKNLKYKLVDANDLTAEKLKYEEESLYSKYVSCAPELIEIKDFLVLQLGLASTNSAKYFSREMRNLIDKMDHYVESHAD